MKFIDDFLNITPMYKLVMYALLLISLASFVLSFTGVLSYSLESLAISILLCTFVSVATNFLYARILKLPLQHESSVITALILFLILLPANDTFSTIYIFIASFLAISSKYILVLRNTHIFNPAAVGIYSVTFLSLFLGNGTSFWWVGSIYLLPIVLLTGLLIVRKTRRETLFITSIIAAFFGCVLSSYFFSMNFLEVLSYTFLSGPLIFFIAFMITEPHTIAKNKLQQIFYGLFIILLPVGFNLAEISNMPPELALLVGNLLSFVISHRQRYVLKLQEIKKLNNDTYEYIFQDKVRGSVENKFNFSAGEFLEWVVPHDKQDSRGVRRYFTISSTPNSSEISFATKFPPEKESSFKNTLKEIKVGDTVYASQQGGDFLLSNLKNKNIIMIAGGIGITPFISQLRDLSEKVKTNKIAKEDVSIALFYCARSEADTVYKELLQEAVKLLPLKVVYVLGTEAINKVNMPNFFYETGYLTEDILNKYTQSHHNQYYISGPNMMVEMIEKMISKSKKGQVHTDYFPGF